MSFYIATCLEYALEMLYCRKRRERWFHLLLEKTKLAVMLLVLRWKISDTYLWVECQPRG